MKDIHKSLGPIVLGPISPHVVGLTALGLEILFSYALEQHGPRLLKTFCPRTPSLRVCIPMSQGPSPCLLRGQCNLFVLGFDPRTNEISMVLFVFPSNLLLGLGS